MREAGVGSGGGRCFGGGALPVVQHEYALAEALVPPPPELIPVVLPEVQPAQPSPGAAGEAGAETVHPQEEQASVPEGENEATVVAAEFPAKPAATRRRRKPKSALQTLIEVVAGGVAGCLVAYYGLALYYGPEFAAKGLPILPLPGIESLTAPRPADAAKEKSPEKKPAKSKSKSADPAEPAASSPCSPRQDIIKSG